MDKRAIGTVLIALAGLVQAASAWSACILVVQHGPVPALGAPPDEQVSKKFRADYMEPLINAMKIRTKDLDLISSDAGGRVDIGAQAINQRKTVDGCSLAISTKLIMSSANGAGWLIDRGRRNPFPNIPTSFKNFGTGNSRDRVKALTIGWIPRNYPELDVSTEGDTNVIRIKSGHMGWPEYTAGALANSPPSHGPEGDVESAVDWMASPEASEIMGKWFWVVPDNSRLKRRLRIDVVNDKKEVLASTECSSQSCWPKMTNETVTFKGKDGGTYSVCGGKAAACPQFMPRDGIEMKATKAMQR